MRPGERCHGNRSRDNALARRDALFLCPSRIINEGEKPGEKKMFPVSCDAGKVVHYLFEVYERAIPFHSFVASGKVEEADGTVSTKLILVHVYIMLGGCLICGDERIEMNLQGINHRGGRRRMETNIFVRESIDVYGRPMSDLLLGLST